MCTKIGIWLDNHQAAIIRLQGKSESLKHIESNVEDFNLKGGSRSKVPYGPQDNVSESKLLERKKSQHKKYYEEIISEVEDASYLTLFGPAEAKIGLKKVLDEHPVLKDKTTSVEVADSMSENQMKALVRTYYRNHHF